MITQSGLAFILAALGLGAFSSLFFVWQWTLGWPHLWTAWLLFFGITAAVVTVFLRLRRQIPRGPSLSGGYWLLFGVASGYAAYLVHLRSRVIPHGAWDAWAIWNLHARFLYRGEPTGWRELFAPILDRSQNDYPLMLPGLVRAFWTMAGGETQIVPALLAIVFSFLAIGILSCAVSTLSGDHRGSLAGLIFLATPSFLLQSSTQCADIPLGLYVLIGGVLLQFAEEWSAVRTPLLALSGFSIGLAAWTKNEGIVAVVALLIAHAVLVALRRGWRSYVKEAASISAGLAPMLVLLVAFKVLLAPPGDFPLDRPAIEHLVDVQRYRVIARGFASGLLTFGDASGGMSPLILVALYLVLYWSPTQRARPSALTLLVVPFCMLAGDFAAYLITPRDVVWHMSTSFDRLLVQAWPVSLFALTVVPTTTVRETLIVGVKNWR